MTLLFSLVLAIQASSGMGGPTLSEQETAALIAEAAQWRSGLANGTRDLGRAVEMYRLAVARGSGRSSRHGAYELATLKETGCRWPAIDASTAGECPIDRDVAGALRFYGTAAAAGHPGAQRALGAAFGSGAFVLGNAGERGALEAYARAQGAFNDALPRDDTAVLHEYFAALGRDPLAAMALGSRHLSGRGVPQSCDAALVYYEAAADVAAAVAQHEGAFRPNERARLDVDAGASTAARGRLVGLGAAWAARMAAAARWVSRNRRTKDPFAKRDHADVASTASLPLADPDEPWAPVLGQPTWRDADPFWGVGGAPARGSDVLRYYRHAADAGDAAARLALGHLHYHGSRGIAQNLARAAHYFELAAEAGDDPAALGWAGLVYAQGLGVPVDATRAEVFLRAGEARGDAVALDGLGLLALRVPGGSTDAARDVAAAYFRRASEKGHADALYHLGLVHLGWDGRAKGEDSAIDALATALARSNAARSPGSRHRDTTAMLRQLRRDAQKALQFFSLAAQNGHVRALRQVGRIYARGIGVSQSCEVATNAFRTVAERGPWVRGLADARAAFSRGDARGARRAYAALAEAGNVQRLGPCIWWPRWSFPPSTQAMKPPRPMRPGSSRRLRRWHAAEGQTATAFFPRRARMLHAASMRAPHAGATLVPAFASVTLSFTSTLHALSHITRPRAVSWSLAV